MVEDILQLLVKNFLTQAKNVYILQESKMHLLLSIGQLCDHGCIEVFKKNRVSVAKDNEVIIKENFN